MNKQSSPINKLSLLDDVDTQPILEWLTANKKNILTGFAILFALLILSYRILAQNAANSETDYVYAQIVFRDFQESAQKDGLGQEKLIELESILQRHPELHAKYDGAVAETLLIRGEVAKATPFAQSVFERTSVDNLNFYQTFGKTSLLIASGDYQNAYEKVKELKIQMDEDTTHNYGPVLYGYNLIRIASLQQVLGFAEEENRTWEELKKYAIANEGFSDLDQVFAEGKASLAGYVESRQNVLQGTQKVK